MNLNKALAVLAGAGILLSAPLPVSLSADEGIPGKEKTIAILGSSIAAGWVTSRETKHDMENGFAQRLGRLLEPRGFKVVNISVPGDTTEKVLARLDKDLFPLEPDFVVIALSLENEGIRGLGGEEPDQVYAGFKAGLQTIIERCRQRGIVPILGSCYANDNFTQAAHDTYIKNMNLEIGAWKVPSINLLGALDRGDGQFVPGITFDLDHPADRGHRELFHSVVPSLFQALGAGKPLPVRETGPGCTTLGRTGSGVGMLSYVPADPVHSFTSVVDLFPRSEGVLTAFLGLDGALAALSITAEGHLAYRSTGGAVKVIQPSFLDKTWHHLGIVHHGLKNETIVYVDGIPCEAIPDAFRPVQFTVGGAGSAEADCRDWMIFRAPLNTDEIKRLRSGALLQSSLEVYAPLREGLPGRNCELVNRAQSLGRVVSSPADTERDITRLRAEWKREEEEERTFVDLQEKQAVPMALEILESRVGTYEGPSGLVMTVERKGNRLFLLLNDGQAGTVELFPLSPERYFVKSVGSEIEIFFSSDRNEDGRPENLLLKIDGREIPGKRKS